MTDNLQITGGSTISDFLMELGFFDQAQQSIWSKRIDHRFVLTLQFTDAGTPEDKDTWWFSAQMLGGAMVMEFSSPDLGDCLRRVYLFEEAVKR